MTKNFIKNYLNKVKEISDIISIEEINTLALSIFKVRKNNGRIFFLGIGGSAGNCSHAVNDFRKICKIESYTPIDNVSELTARINDEGWESSLSEWLKISNINSKDALFIMSVGGGNKLKGVSENLIKAMDFAKKNKTKIFGIIGKKDGYAKIKGDNVLVIPEVDKKLVTPLTESYQSIIWHCLVSHPMLQKNSTKW
tara:strand:- start:802 stop:1392 length:591 start_codon:yes stop_codon:yes gene_type:complete